MDTCSERNQRRYGCISRQELMLSNRMRLLWEQHVYWTRLVISGIVFDSPDLQQSTARLLQNPGDFAETLAMFYGEEAAAEFKTLFTSHLTTAGQLVNELKAGNTKAAAETERRWYENSTEIAAFLSDINPYWSFGEWREMMYRHLDLTKAEAAAFLAKNYEESVLIFNQIEQEALEMADEMTIGLIRQF